jgi:hypothetical protein
MNRKETAVAAIAAAKRSIEEKINIATLVKETGISKTTLSLARIIAEFGTPENIEDANSAKIGIRILGTKISKALSPEIKKQLHGRQGFDPMSDEHLKKLQTDAELWSKLKPALNSLVGFPRPQDVVESIRGNHMREMVVNQQLTPALNWLRELEHEWAKYQQAKSGENLTDAGAGDTTIRTQHTKSAA